MPSFTLPSFSLPFDLPTFELPRFELPAVELPSLEQVTTLTRDAALVGVGLTVMSLDRLQALSAQLAELATSSANTVAARIRNAV
jgi:hypothetical protein